MKLQFLGAAGTVTGSRHLLHAAGRRILVDCGLFQGLKELRLQNRAPFPVDPASVDAVILTHAHLDHSGYLPLFVKRGFRGQVYCTDPTRDLTEILLADAAHIEEEDAESANRMGYSKHKPAEPLFTVADVQAACLRLRITAPGAWTELFPGVRFRLQPSGHILGSAFVEVEAEGKRVAFSGDLGRAHPLLLPPRVLLEEADYLVVESTYGDRLHPPEAPLEELARIVTETASRRGHLLVPSFAVGRTQDLLFLFAELKKRSMIPDLPIYLDSPLATEATEIFLRHREWQCLGDKELRELAGVAHVTKTREQSKALLDAHASTIVIAGSGMVSGGRILHHLDRRIGDPRSTVLLVGYQAPGTRGVQLLRGAREIKMHGKYHQVNVQVRELPGLSAHADQGEILEWLRGFRRPPRGTFLVHGEPHAADTLRVKIGDALGWSVSIPKQLEEAELG